MILRVEQKLWKAENLAKKYLKRQLRLATMLHGH
jgi:hypothetical protein